MQPASSSLPEGEAEGLHRLNGRDSKPALSEYDFEEVTQLAAALCGTSCAAVALAAACGHQRFSMFGAATREVPRAALFHQHALRCDGLFLVADARLDERFSGQNGEACPIRFFAGVPLWAEDGERLGTLAVMDEEPRHLSEAQLRSLQLVANQVLAQMELRHQRVQLERARTEKEALERQLEKERADLHDAQRMAGVGSWRRNLEDDRLHWTDEVYRIFGLEPRSIEPTFEVFLNQVHPDDRDSLRWARKKTLERGEPLDIEHRIIRPDGSVRQVHERAELIFDNEGKVVGIAGTVADITDRSGAEVVLRESERRYREIVQASPDLVLVEHGGRITFINDAGMRLLRATYMEQVIGRPLLEFVQPEFVEAVRERVEWLLETPRLAPAMEVRIAALDGTVMDVELRINSFPSGREVALQVRCRDMTERNRVQAALKASETRLRQILDALPMAAYTCDVNGLITYFNEKAQELWGRTPRLNSETDRYCGSMRLLHSDGTPLQRENWWMAVTLNQCRAHNGGEAIMVRPDGSHRYVTAHTNPFFDGEGNLVGAVNVLMDVTQRRQAEAALQESEKRFRTVAKAATDAIWDWDIVSDTIWWSDGIHTLFGYAPHEMPADGHTWARRIHPDDQKRVVEGIFRAIESNEDHWQEEYYFQRSDGSYAYVLDRGFVIRGEDGKPLKMIGGMTDLSDRRRIERHLQESEAKFRELAENIDAVFYNHDLATERLLYISPAYERIWGRSCQSAYDDPRSYLNAVHGRDAEAVWLARAKLVEGQETDLEYRIVTPDGGMKWIRDRSYPVLNAQGEVERVVGNAYDITERKLADQRVLEQAELLDIAHDAIIVRDLNHCISYWNRSAETLYGWSAQEVVGRCVTDLVECREDEFEQAVQELLSGGEWSGELHQVSKDGREIIVEARWTLVKDERDLPVSVFAIHTDITERKRMESHFLRAQRMESLGTLAGGIAHDLNNVLAPILMSIDLLKLTERSSSDLSIFSTIELSARRGAEMVQQVLSFARGVEGRRLVLEPAEIVREIQHIVHETFPKNIEFQASLKEDLPTFVGDPTQVHQVLINLCVNARDAMPGGGRIVMTGETVVVDAAYAASNPHSRPGRYVALKVADNGSGIPQVVKDKIFEPFFTTKELGKGTGLGLSTVLAIVKSHGGFIRVESEPGQGSTFWVCFPAQAERQGARSILAEDVHPRGAGELVLVVDDEESVRLITRQTLEAYGYRVVTACDGADALAVYAQHAEDVQVVLTDVMMPVMDGPSAIQVLLRMNPGLHIIAVSGLNSSAGADLVTQMGVRHLLPKPYTVQSLLLTLQELLGPRV